MPEQFKPQFGPRESEEKREEDLRTDKKIEGKNISEEKAKAERSKEEKEELNEIMEKVKDLRSGKGILAHESFCDNLECILREGILSRKFAERASEKLEKLPWHDPLTHR